MARGFIDIKDFFQFFRTLLNGYGQVLICLNRRSGLIFSLGILAYSPAVWVMTFTGVCLATLTAYLFKGKAAHIDSGVYGFNGVILGLAWPWFVKLNLISILFFSLSVCLSSLIAKYLINLNIRLKTHLPFLSVPSILLIWLVVISFHIFPGLQDYQGPDQGIAHYTQVFKTYIFYLNRDFSLPSLWQTFSLHIMILAFVTVAVGWHSRRSAGLALLALIITILMVFFLGGILEFEHLEFYLYNSIPAAIALGGIFLVLTRSVLLLTFTSVCLVNLMVFLGLQYFPLPIFVLPFNLVTILLIWFVKSGRLKKELGFHAIPLDLVSTPELGQQWLKGEIYAENYWRDIERRHLRGS